MSRAGSAIISLVSIVIGGVLGGSLVTAVYQNASHNQDVRTARLLAVGGSINDLKQAQVLELSANAASFENSGRKKWRNGVDLALRDVRNAKGKAVHNAITAAPEDAILTDCVDRFQDSITSVVYAHSLRGARAANTRAQQYLRLTERQIRKMINSDSIWKEITNDHAASKGHCPSPD